MIKKISIALLLLINLVALQGQIAIWRLHPIYDTIYKPSGANYYVTQNKGNQIYTIWSNTTFRHLCQIEGEMHEIHDGIAVYTNKGGTLLKGFINNTGKNIQLPTQSQYHIDKRYPYFSDGYLVVQDYEKNYLYINRNGEPSRYRYQKAEPFFHGYSSCVYYQDQVNRKNPRYGLINNNLGFVQFSNQKERFSYKDIDFVSSVNDEHIAIFVAKKKAYLYNTLSKTLTPLCSKKDDINPRNQTRLSENLSNSLLGKERKYGLVVCNRKGEKVVILFDEYMRPSFIKYTDSDVHYRNKPEEEPTIKTPIRLTKKEGKYGINYGDIEILVPQFEAIASSFENMVIVRKYGRYGVIQLLPDRKISAWFFEDNNTAIPFVHKDMTAPLHINIPKEIASDSVDIYYNIRPECIIDKSSRHVHITQTSNWLQYDCKITIPPALFKQEIAEIEIPFQIWYDGLISPMLYVRKKATIRKYWAVKVENERIFAGDSATFDLSLEYSDPLARNAKYGVSVTVQPKGNCTIDTFTFTKYRCTAHHLKRGKNDFKIIIAEDGFPPTIIPYSLDYIPPEPQQPLDNGGIRTLPNDTDPRSGAKNPTHPDKPDPSIPQRPNF